jgi:hypothetical protein
MYITPVWMGILEVIELAVIIGTSLLWGALEFVWWRWY